jgi:hypothetical protein
MGQDALVDAQVRGGEELLARLAASGFEVATAFWAKPDGEPWFLYIATPAVDTNGPRGAYAELFSRLGPYDDTGIGLFEIRVISPSDTMAVAAMDVTRPKPARGPFAVSSPKPYAGMTRFNGSRLGGVDVDGVLIYPPRPAHAP